MNEFILNENTGMKFIPTFDLDFGSIHINPDGDYTLLADDINKLNNVLTKSVCTPYLIDTQVFNVKSGAIAVIANWKTAGTAKAYIYEPTSDAWYEYAETENAGWDYLFTKDSYIELSKLVDLGTLIVQNQASKKLYDGEAFAEFNSNSGIYKRCKFLRDSGDIFNKTGVDAYTTPMLLDLADKLQVAIDKVEASKLKKEALFAMINEAARLVDDTTYQESYRNDLRDILEAAREIYAESTNQAEIDEVVQALGESINEVKNHPV